MGLTSLPYLTFERIAFALLSRRNRCRTACNLHLTKADVRFGSLWKIVSPGSFTLDPYFMFVAYFRPVLLELFGSTIGPYLLDVFSIKNWFPAFGSSGRRFFPSFREPVPVLYLVYIIASVLVDVNSFSKEIADFLEKKHTKLYAKLCKIRPFTFCGKWCIL